METNKMIRSEDVLIFEEMGKILEELDDSGLSIDSEKLVGMYIENKD